VAWVGTMEVEARIDRGRKALKNKVQGTLKLSIYPIKRPGIQITPGWATFMTAVSITTF
jgi:hypothetical protein